MSRCDTDEKGNWQELDTESSGHNSQMRQTGREQTYTKGKGEWEIN